MKNPWRNVDYGRLGAPDQPKRSRAPRYVKLLARRLRRSRWGPIIHEIATLPRAGFPVPLRFDDDEGG